MFLISGNQQYAELAAQADERPDWRLEAFIHDGMALILAAADIVVARAGATTLLELAALHKPTIIIPNGKLTAGHQLKNAKVYQDALAAVVLNEEELADQPQVLVSTVHKLLHSPRILSGLGRNFAKFARPEAAQDMARIILTTIRREGRRR